MRGLSGFLPLVVLAALFYLLLIRPQRNRQRQAQALLSKIAPGDRVLTSGGMFGTVIEVEDTAVYLELAPGVDVRFVKAAIQRVVSPDEDAAVLEDADADPVDVDAVGEDATPTTDPESPTTPARVGGATGTGSTTGTGGASAAGATAAGVTAFEPPDGSGRDRS